MTDDLHFRTYEPKAGYDPSEPRDEGGKWTDSGGGDGGGEESKPAAGGKKPSAPKGPKLPGVKDVPKYAGQRHGDTLKDGSKIYDNRVDPSYFANHSKLKDVDKLTTVLAGRTSKKGTYYVREWATANKFGEPHREVRVDNAGRIHVGDRDLTALTHRPDPHKETYDLRQHRADQTHSIMQDAKGDRHPGKGYSKSAVLRPDGSIYTTDVNDAAKALFEGKKVELDQPKKVSTLIHKLGNIVANWQTTFKGEKDPVFNLCDVSVSGTNLFCAESKGIPRPQMPQLDAQQTADFVKQLGAEGLKITEGQEFASHLRATQNQLGGKQVASNLDRLEKQKGDMTGAPPLIVSKDDYILDGHHRWAAKIGYDFAQGKLDDKLKMRIQRVDIDIITLVNKANAFTGGKGAKEIKAYKQGLIYRTTVERDWDEEKHPRGKTTPESTGGSFAPAEGGDGDGESQPSGGGKPNYGFIPGDVEKFKSLKAEWAKVNNELLAYVDKPDGPESKARIDKLEAIVKEIHGLHADPGTAAGIGLPGGPRDVTIIGAGPGGLAASINGAAEGLDTLVVEANVVPGGQAKFSSRIENFPGFPIGITGERLTQNMFEQAQRLGAESKLGVRVTGMTYDDSTGLKHIKLSNGEEITSRTVILAGGLEFRRMSFPGSDGPGVIVGDGKALAKAGVGGNVCVIGGSNGAAQAALGCALKDNHVYLLARSPIANSMSDYQIAALRNSPKVTVIENDSIASLSRDAQGNPTSMQTAGGKTLDIKALGLFVGSMPDTKWVPPYVAIEKGGRVQTNDDLETGAPGVYAVGDMREGAIGRIGVAAGEGQLALRQANVYLDKLRKQATAAKADTTSALALITSVFDLDRDNPWFGQTIEGVTPLKVKPLKKNFGTNLNTRVSLPGRARAGDLPKSAAATAA